MLQAIESEGATLIGPYWLRQAIGGAINLDEDDMSHDLYKRIVCVGGHRLTDFAALRIRQLVRAADVQAGSEVWLAYGQTQTDQATLMELRRLRVDALERRKGRMVANIDNEIDRMLADAEREEGE